MNPRKTILNGKEYEIVSAEVVDVDFSGSDREKLYSVICKILGAQGSQGSYNLIQARALDANIKNIPIIGEVVMLLKGPTAYNSYVGTGQEYYYTNPVSIQSSVHHNGLPGVSDVAESQTPNNPQKRQNSQDGIPSKNTNNQSQRTIDPAFPERTDVYPLQFYSGDIILEGRWGQSIRFSSTLDERRDYPVPSYWKKGLSDVGNPILVISNGSNTTNKKYNEFTQENPDTDDASIWMASGQEVKFTPASSYTPSIKDKNVDLFNKNKFGGNQVILASDRIIFNARKQELIAFSKEGIGLSSEKAISLDGKQVVETESKRINLGLNAKSPVLLGDRSMDWLNELCDLLSRLLTTLTVTTVPTGVGPSGPPITTPEFININSELKLLQLKIEKLQSRLAFVNEFSAGPTDDAKAKESEREQRQEKRDAGEEPPRQKSSPDETALTPRDTRTGTEWQGFALWDPNQQTVYGVRDKDATTWFYDSAWKKYLTDMSKFNPPANYETNKDTTFDSDLMSAVVNKDAGSISNKTQSISEQSDVTDDLD